MFILISLGQSIRKWLNMYTIYKNRELNLTLEQLFDLSDKVRQKAIRRTITFNDNNKNYYWYWLNDINECIKKSLSLNLERS